MGRTCTLRRMATLSDDAMRPRAAWWASGCGRHHPARRTRPSGASWRCRRRSTAYARWSVGQRSSTRASEVDAAFDAGAILRTHVLRPTWHFAATDDLRWLLALTGPILERRNARRDEELELDARTRRRATDLIADAVGTGPLTRRELADVLEQRGIAHRRATHRAPPVPRRAARGGVQRPDAREACTPTPRSTRGCRRVSPTRGRPLGGAGAALVHDPRSRHPARLRVVVRAPDGRRAGRARGSAVGAHVVRTGRPHVLVRRRREAGQGAARRSRAVLRRDDHLLHAVARRPARRPTSRSPSRGSIDGFVHVLLCDGRLLGHWRVACRRWRPGGDALARLSDREEAALAAAVGRYEEFART